MATTTHWQLQAANGQRLMRIGYTPSLAVIPFAAAIASGLAEEQGLQLRLIHFNDILRMHAALAEGEVDVILADQSSTALAVAMGLDAQMIAACAHVSLLIVPSAFLRLEQKFGYREALLLQRQYRSHQLRVWLSPGTLQDQAQLRAQLCADADVAQVLSFVDVPSAYSIPNEEDAPTLMLLPQPLAAEVLRQSPTLEIWHVLDGTPLMLPSSGVANRAHADAAAEVGVVMRAAHIQQHQGTVEQLVALLDRARDMKLMLDHLPLIHQRRLIRWPFALDLKRLGVILQRYETLFDPHPNRLLVNAHIPLVRDDLPNMPRRAEQLVNVAPYQRYHDQRRTSFKRLLNPFRRSA